MKRLVALLLVCVLVVLSVPAFADFAPIAKGAQGTAIKGIQSRLIELGFLSGKADGDFGSATEQAVMDFQASKSLEATGIVDEPTYDALYEGAEGLITFRGIKWFTAREQTEELLTSEGMTKARTTSQDIYRVTGPNYRNVTMGRDRVDDAGCRVRYEGLSVAGYDIEDTYACYIYPIDNGAIVRDESLAEFYMAWYDFIGYADQQAIHDDLTQKLTSLYGDGAIEHHTFFDTTTWTDMQGNFIRLLYNPDSQYVVLVYMAGDAERRLDEMQEAQRNEAIANEAQEREENISNTSGL